MKAIKFWMYLNLFITPFMGLLWINPLTDTQRDSLGYVSKFLFSGFFLLCLGYTLFNLFEKRKVKNKNVFNIVAFLFFLDIIFTVVGLMNGFGAKIVNDFISFIGGPLILLTFQQSSISNEEINKFANNIAHLIFITFGCAIGMMYYESYLGLPFYFGLSCIPLVFSFFYFLSRRSLLKCALALLLIVLSGKRGVSGALIIAGLLTFFLYKGLSFTMSIISSIALIVPVFLALFWSLSLMVDSGEANSVVINRLNNINPFQEKSDVESASGEREEEIEQSLLAQKKYFLSSLIGAGNGFTYELAVARKGMFQEERHNVHFSPVSYYTKYGIFFTVFWYFILLFSFNFQSGIFKEYKFIIPFLGYQITSFFFSFTVFSLSIDYLFWASMSFSILMSNNNKELKLKNAALNN